jgi:hypothetical protein
LREPHLIHLALHFGNFALESHLGHRFSLFFLS